MRSGVPEETASMLWRALGFPDAPDGTASFTDESVEVLRLLTERAGTSMFSNGDDIDSLVAQVRAIGAALARVAETLSDQIVEGVSPTGAGLDDEAVALLSADALDWKALARLNDFALRVQVRAAVLRKLLTPQLGSGALPELAVGFVDLVGYTALSQELDGSELNALVARFESVTYDTVARLGGRLVKTIGDEVMFVAEDPAVGLQIALELTDRTHQDEVLPRRGPASPAGPRWPGKATTTAPWSTSRTGWSRSPGRSRSSCRPSWPTRSATTGFTFQRLAEPAHPRDRPGGDLRGRCGRRDPSRIAGRRTRARRVSSGDE